jgi:secreted trypsin-like serine protease
MRCGWGLPAEACEADSGGPPAHMDIRPPVLIGILSFGMETAGKPCGADGPDFFTSAAVTRAWIERQLRT